MRLPRLPFALIAALALIATACNGDPVDIAEPDDEPVEGGTLAAALGGDPDQLDPHTTTSSFAFTVLENVYDTLVQPAEDLTMEPALAEDWEVSDDLLTWTFDFDWKKTGNENTYRLLMQLGQGFELAKFSKRDLWSAQNSKDT